MPKKGEIRLKRCLTTLAFLCCLLCAFVVTASAESAATRVDYYATVNVDGDCLITMTVLFHFEEDSTGAVFPLPVNAGNITLNNGSVSTARVGNYTAVYLDKATGGNRGDYTVQFAYTLPGTVTPAEDKKSLLLDLPILSGFSYPILSLNYTITLPRENEAIPGFYSTYRQNGIASDLSCIPEGNMITGSSKTAFNDHESLNMTLQAPLEMFPGVSVYQRTGNPEIVPMGILAGIAMLYWLLFLRTLPPGRLRTSTPPAGISAGELGCRTTLSGGELTTMVFSWAQMGYLLIHVDRSGRVLLHKRMDMGNERSLFEVQVFQALFANRRVIDGTGFQYAKQCKRTSTMIPGAQAQLKSNFGNPKIFRLLFCAAQVFCGICMAMNLTTIGVLQVLLSIILGAIGAVTAWLIQEGAYCLGRRRKTKLYIALSFCLFWLGIGLLAKQPLIPLAAVVCQLIAGYFAAFGGRRTDLNRYEMAQIFGLRRYLKKMTAAEAAKQMKADPDFFFRLAPYALAMGVLKPFAAAFGKRKLEQCPYLVTTVHGRKRADEWAYLMVTAADHMDARFRRMEVERWLPVNFR